jgi:hypothetical protein
MRLWSRPHTIRRHLQVHPPSTCPRTIRRRQHMHKLRSRTTRQRRRSTTRQRSRTRKWQRSAVDAMGAELT